MEEQRISFETAQWANNKNFNEKVNFHYTNGGVLCKSIKYKNSQKGSEVTAPTQSALQTWLRDTHKMKVLVVLATKYDKNGDEVEYYRPMWGYHLKDKWLLPSDDYYEKYEDALEIGLVEGLKKLN